MEILLIIMAQMVILGIPKHTEIILIIMITGAIIALHHDTGIKFIQTAIRNYCRFDDEFYAAT